ncbi:DUF5657 family protein [Patescibacteria group bacterium]
MGIDILQNVIILEGLSKILSLFLVVVLGFYFVFAVLIVKQVSLLNKSFKTDASFILVAFSSAHLVATIILLLFTLTTLF